MALPLQMYENCRVNEGAHLYCQRRQGVTLPAAGYDPEGFSGGWTLGNAMGYRAEDGAHLVMKDGAKVPDGFAIGGPPPARDPLGSLLLQLGEGAFASYTVRMVKQMCAVTLRARSLEGGKLLATEGKRAVEVEVPAGSTFVDYPLPTLEPADARTVCIKSVQGSVQLESISFSK